jgi:hypothetical protein
MPGLSVFRDHRGKVVVRSLHLSGLSVKRQLRHPRALSELAGNISSLLQKMIAADGSGGELLVHSLFQGGSKGGGFGQALGEAEAGLISQDEICRCGRIFA